MRAALENVRDAKPISPKNEQRLLAARLVVPASIQAHMETGVRVWAAPRGHSALSAPKMTRKEYECLCALEQCTQRGLVLWTRDGQWARGYDRCKAAGWANFGEISDAGSKALNDMRAADGSSDWKETT
jgi:hypothetical protein